MTKIYNFNPITYSSYRNQDYSHSTIERFSNGKINMIQAMVEIFSRENITKHQHLNYYEDYLKTSISSLQSEIRSLDSLKTQTSKIPQKQINKHIESEIEKLNEEHQKIKKEIKEAITAQDEIIYQITQQQISCRRKELELKDSRKKMQSLSSQSSPNFFKNPSYKNLRLNLDLLKQENEGLDIEAVRIEESQSSLGESEKGFLSPISSFSIGAKPSPAVISPDTSILESPIKEPKKLEIGTIQKLKNKIQQLKTDKFLMRADKNTILRLEKELQAINEEDYLKARNTYLQNKEIFKEAERTAKAKKSKMLIGQNAIKSTKTHLSNSFIEQQKTNATLVSEESRLEAIKKQLESEKNKIAQRSRNTGDLSSRSNEEKTTIERLQAEMKVLQEKIKKLNQRKEELKKNRNQKLNQKEKQDTQDYLARRLFTTQSNMDNKKKGVDDMRLHAAKNRYFQQKKDIDSISKKLNKLVKDRNQKFIQEKEEKAKAKIEKKIQHELIMVKKKRIEEDLSVKMQEVFLKEESYTIKQKQLEEEVQLQSINLENALRDKEKEVCNARVAVEQLEKQYVEKEAYSNMLLAKRVDIERAIQGLKAKKETVIHNHTKKELHFSHLVKKFVLQVSLSAKSSEYQQFLQDRLFRY